MAGYLKEDFEKKVYDQFKVWSTLNLQEKIFRQSLADSSEV